MSDIPIAGRPSSTSGFQFRTRHAVAIAVAAFCVLCASLLMLPLSVPIGPMYWDTYIYYDGINRVLDGQIPSVDFEAPVGALNYWLATLMHLAFPEGQPLLLIHFSLLIISAPLIAIIAIQAANRSNVAAWGLLLPFLFFAALPFDTVSFYPFPGVDGFGYYNRHGSQLMYLAAASVFFVERRKVQAGLLCIIVTALFLSKITAFLAAGLILAFGLFAGLIAPVSALTVAAFFFATIGLLEYSTGMIGAYAQNIIFLVGANESALLSRFLTVLSQRFDVALCAGFLVLAVLFSQLRSSWPERGRVNGRILSAWLQRLLDHDYLAIGACLLAGIVFETQNTGSQAFLVIWPPILHMLLRMNGAKVVGRTSILVLVALATLPTLTATGHRAIRAMVAGLTYDRLESKHLGTLGRVTAKDLFLRRAEILNQAYPDEPGLARFIADRGEPLSAILASEPDFQLLCLKIADEAISAILELEARRDRRFETIFTLDFTNPFPFLMDRHGPLGVAIGADPFRTVPAMQEKARAAISETGLVLLPTCPDMTSRRLLLKTYGAALAGHERITLTPCYDAFIR